MVDQVSANSNEVAESDVLSAIQNYNVALKDQDVDGQLDFFAASWRSSSGTSRDEFREQLQAQLDQGVREQKHFDLDGAVVTLDEDTATVDQVPLRSLTGNGTFTFLMTKEADGIWRCTALFLSKLPDTFAEHARTIRERVLGDPERPGYHFVVPEGIAMPFDPNGAIYWRGRYHLFYIFQDSRSGERADHWGHMSSRDLFHWRHHPTGLLDGMYSGNCFINREGIPTICYHQKGVGNALAVALDDDLNQWRKLESNPITPLTESGDEFHDKYRSWDPFGWCENESYYAIFGGKRPAVAKSPSLAGKWEYVGDLFAHGVEGVSLDEDVSCPDLFKLGEKHVLLCISHRLGCRYYVGKWKNERFYPESHAQMSWVDNSFFAPESLIDDRGRRIMWSWIMDEPEFGVRSANGWSGVLSLPRVLTLSSVGELGIDVPEEIESLRYGGSEMLDFKLENDDELWLDETNGSSLELKMEIESNEAIAYGVRVCASPDRQEETSVYYDAIEGTLNVDTRKSGPENTPKAIESAPFKLSNAEHLELRVFVDKSVVEVFANRRQAIARRIYPSRADSVGVSVFSQGGASHVRKLSSWQITQSNP